MDTGIKKTQRIEYIDALRGFTMILVVLHHVSLIGFEIDSAIGKWLIEFRMPLFFFISGFVFYKSSQAWDISNIISFLKKKFPIQILSPFIFFSLYIYIYDKDLLSSLADPNKAGYWFTFMLFVYFILYIISSVCLDKLSIVGRKRDLCISLIGLFVFFLAYYISYLLLEKNNLFAGFIGGANLKYFLFFVLGTLVKKHFSLFQNLLDSSPLIAISITSYFLMNIFYEPVYNLFGSAYRILFILLTAITGIIGLFAFFRKYQYHFSINRPLGRVLQNIGRRTLDIYLLHYFFIPIGLNLFPRTLLNIPLIEFICSLFIAFLIIAICIAISMVLRTSPFLATFLFGAKNDIK